MDTELAYPKLIGPYRILGRLGSGGMGEVLSGYDDRLDRPVALKHVLQGARDPEKARQRFRREARAVARLSHPAIVQVYDWVESDDGDWLVMELVSGRPLDELIVNGPLSPERAAAIAREVTSGLAAAHEVGLVHRDLKAANVMVTANGGAKILDFGLAKTVVAQAVGADLKTTLTEEGQVVGTVSAMSPEQALGRSVDHRSDLFSLGILLYEMLSGVSPFEGDSAVETLTRICTAKEEPLRQLDPKIPEGLARLVEHLLEKEPVRRPPGARQVVAELDRLSGGDAKARLDIDVSASNSQKITLVDEARGMADSGTIAVPKGSGRRWVLLIVFGMLLLTGLWGLSSRLRRPVERTLNTDAPAMSARSPTDNTGLNSHTFYQRGMAYLERYDRKNNIDRAITELQRALARDESSASAHAGLARAYWLDAISGSKDPVRLQQALAAAEHAVALDEHLAFAWVSRGLARSKLGRDSEAMQDFEQALLLEPLNAEAHKGIAQIHEGEGKLRKAEEHYRLAIQARPEGWEFHALLGALFLRGSRYEEAEKIFLRTIELVPDNFLAIRNLGAAYYLQGRLSEAATQFQQALQIQPEPSLYANLGTIYFAQGLYAQSVLAFEKSIAVGSGSNDYRLWGNLGDAYRWTPDHDSQAREAYLRAIQLLQQELNATPDIALRTRLALFLAKRGDFDQALRQIGTIADPPANDAYSWFRLATAKEICGLRGDALSALETALKAGLSISEVQLDPELLKLRQDAQYHRLVMRFQP